MRQMPHEGPRMETGPVQFGDDWPGVFIRGHRAIYWAMIVRQTLRLVGEFPYEPELRSLADALESCDLRNQEKE